MQAFGTLADYMAAQLTQGDLAAVPVALAAVHLGISTAAVSSMLKRDRLEGVCVNGVTLVTLSGLQERQTKRAGQESTVDKYLRKLAKSGKRAVFYEPVMAQVSLHYKIPADRKRIGGILGAVSEKSFEEDGVMLSVLVHRKTAGITRPGKGFFELAYNLGFSLTDLDAFVREQTDRVLDVYG